MDQRSYFSEAPAVVNGYIENMFVAPSGSVFICGRINSAGRTLIGVIDQGGNWVNSTENLYRLGDANVPNAPAFVRNIHIMPDYSVIATGRFVPSAFEPSDFAAGVYAPGVIAKFLPDGKLDRKFAEEAAGLNGYCPTAVGSCPLGRDKILIHGTVGEPANSDVLFTADGLYRCGLLNDGHKIQRAVSLPDGRVIALVNRLDGFIAVLKADGRVDEEATMQLNLFGQGEFRLLDGGNPEISVSPAGKVIFWSFKDETRIFAFNADLTPDVEANRMVRAALQGERMIPKIFNDSGAVWLDGGKILFYNCGVCRNKSGVIFDPASGFDLSSLDNFLTPADSDGRYPATIQSAVWLPEAKKVLLAELLLGHNGDNPRTRLSLISLAQ